MVVAKRYREVMEGKALAEVGLEGFLGVRVRTRTPWFRLPELSMRVKSVDG